MVKSEFFASGSTDLERLSRTIRNAVAAVEESNPGCFLYNGVSLRGAVERRLYEETAVRPASLQVLCKAGVPHEDFSAWLAERPSSFIRDTFALFKAWARLIYYGLWRAKDRRHAGDQYHPVASEQPAPGKPESTKAEIVFCVLRPRFVSFFLPVIQRLLHLQSRCYHQHHALPRPAQRVAPRCQRSRRRH